ncbi:MAG: hypothetical protein IJ899_15805 [Blautia sp.]|nr:hypothetical protein [Blautia sp.]
MNDRKIITEPVVDDSCDSTIPVFSIDVMKGSVAYADGMLLYYLLNDSLCSVFAREPGFFPSFSA